MDPAETDPHPVSAGAGSGKTGYRSGSGQVEIQRNLIHTRIFPGRDPANRIQTLMLPDLDVFGHIGLFLDNLGHFERFWDV